MASNKEIPNDNDNDGQLTSSSKLTSILDTFPQEPLVHAFGYGSGVFSQTLKGGPQHEGMLDLILVIDESSQETTNSKEYPQEQSATMNFYQQNLQTYPHHYPWSLRTLSLLWPNLLGNLQRNFPLQDAKVLFHVVEDPVPMKYGVVHAKDLIQDLTQWDSLYLAGRLHKPTLSIPLSGDNDNNTARDAILEAQAFNLKAAVAAALLLLPAGTETQQQVPWTQFYSQIAGLSYTGDFRMQVGGEDPLKINKLVQAPGQLERFQNLYQSSTLKPLESAGLISYNSSGLEWNPRDISGTRKHLIQELPPRLQGCLRSSTATLRNNEPSNTMAAISEQQAILSSTLAAIVAPAARHQSFKGLFTLGFRRSVQYASAKLAKGLFRRR